MADALTRRISGRPTLASIAEDADVSLATVSKVLNARPGVSETTRSRVEELLEEHGYRRRAADRPLGDLLELVFEDIDSDWSLQIIRGVEAVARAARKSVVLTESGTRRGQAEGWFEVMLQRHPVGVILVFTDLPEEKRARMRVRNIPFVLLDPAGDPPPAVPAIGSSNFAGGMAAARHLVGLGHRRIAVISGPEDMVSVRARLAGFRAGLDEAGIPHDPSLVIPGDYHIESGREATFRLLSRAEPPTAIFAGNDQQAFGVYEAARLRGVRIPDELSVVGYDDVPPAAWVGPPLTTVRQPLVEMAEEAARLALRLRARGSVAVQRLDLATELVVRGSTCAPRTTPLIPHRKDTAS